MGADLYIKNMDRQAQYTGFQTKPEAGYFRDSYNDSNLFWKMKLSYWQMDTEHPDWFSKDEDGSSELTVAGCFGLLELVKSREDMLKPDDDDAEEQFEALVKLLNKAIELNSPIIWSV